MCARVCAAPVQCVLCVCACSIATVFHTHCHTARAHTCTHCMGHVVLVVHGQVGSI